MVGTMVWEAMVLRICFSLSLWIRVAVQTGGNVLSPSLCGGSDMEVGLGGRPDISISFFLCMQGGFFSCQNDVYILGGRGG